MGMFVKDFEELEVYKLSREIVIDIYNLTLKDQFRRDFDLISQIRRAGISVLSNIAEGFDRGSKKEFVLFLNYAKGSNGELRAQLEISKEINYITPNEYDYVKDKLIRNAKMISCLIKAIKSKNTHL